MKRYLALFSLILLNSWGVCLTEVYASYPIPVDMYINDFSGIISHDDRDILRRNLAYFHHEKNIQIVLITISDLGEDFQNIEDFANAMLKRWQIGGKYHSSAVLILLAVKDRRIRIELGRGYGRRYDRKMQEIIDMHMLPYFKEAEYAAGLHAGTLAVMESVKWFWIKFYALLAIGGLALALAVFAIFPWRRNGRSGNSGGAYCGNYNRGAGGGSGFSGGSGGASGGW